MSLLQQHDQQKFDEALKYICEKLKSAIENGNEVAVITHLDADGLSSGSIIATILCRLGARYTVRAISEINAALLEEMKNENRDFYIFTDLGAGWASHLQKVFVDKWIIIDHHQIPEEEIVKDEAGQVLNAWRYGIDGGTEVSAGGMAYMVANALDRKNRDLSTIALVSAVADRQDQGDKKSFFGLNATILKTAQSLGLVSVDLDIMLSGRETRPLHEALAYTSFPYINGLTWNKESCYAILKSEGIKLKDNGRWRVPAEFSQEEKSTILDVISKFVGGSSKDSPGVLHDLIGYVYTLTKEDTHSHLRDAREFSTMLNACGRIGKAGIGVSICMGDRKDMLSAGEEIIGTYRTTLRNYLSTLFADKWRLVDDGKNVFVNGDGLIAEDMLGAVSSLLSGSPTFSDRLLFVRTLARDGTYRFSSRKCLGSKSQANLGLIMRQTAESFKGNGGGHSSAAGCRIPSQALEDFVARIRAATGDSKFATTS